MLPPFNEHGVLPPGIHKATWPEVVERFGGSPGRVALLEGLHHALTDLRAAGCRRVYLNGSFVTDKENPGDYDMCWDSGGVVEEALPRALRDPHQWRTVLRRRYRGDIFPEGDRAGFGAWTFLDLFQFDRGTGRLKGIVELDLETLP